MNAEQYTDAAQRLRIDKWLWAARFFRTRRMAVEAIERNRVQVDGQKTRPSRLIQIGDRIRIEKPPFAQDVIVRGINDERRPASEAQRLYEETEASLAAREQLATTLRAERSARLGLAGEGRPNKQQRRRRAQWEAAARRDEDSR